MGWMTSFRDSREEYSECLRLKGPHLLDLAAMYADAETIHILSKSNHLRMWIDDAYTVGEFRERIREHAGVTAEIIEEFDILLDTLQRAANSTKSLEEIMEQGLLSPDRESFASGDSDDVFEDAKDSFDPGFEEVERVISHLAKHST